MDGTVLRGDEQHAALVFVEDARSDKGLLFSQRIGMEARIGLQFQPMRQHLPQQRVVGITDLHACGIAAGNAQWKVAQGGRVIACPNRIDLQQLQKFDGIGDQVGELLLPARQCSEGNGRQHQGIIVASPKGRRYDACLQFTAHSEVPMAVFSTNEFKAGLKVLLDNDPCSILENEYVKPGKGQAFNRVKLRNLLNGRVWERTFKSGDTLDGADVTESNMEYLYSDGEFWHFMKTDGSFEQIAADKNAVGDTINWLKEQEVYIVMVWNEAPISVTPPNFIELVVTQTDPGLRGDTATGGSKPATLSSGAIVKVPLFVEEGDILRVDTRSGEYVSRAKK